MAQMTEPIVGTIEIFSTAQGNRLVARWTNVAGDSMEALVARALKEIELIAVGPATATITVGDDVTEVSSETPRPAGQLVEERRGEIQQVWVLK